MTPALALGDLQRAPISTLMEVRTKHISADDTVQDIETFLSEHRLHWAPVLGERGELLGVISEVDLVRFHLDKRDPAAAAAWQLCTYRPVMVDPQTPISEVARLMLERRIHHVIVADGGVICGVVSSLDFVRMLA